MSKLEQNIISHQIWLQRLGTQTASLSIPFVNRMKAEVKEAVQAFGDDARTVKKLNKMLASLESVLDDVTGGWKSTIEKSLKEIADYENKWFRHTLTDNLREEKRSFVSGPTAEELWASVKFIPLSLNDRPVGLIDMLDGWTTSEKNRLARGVQSGFVQGMTTRQIVQQTVGAGGLADISLRDAFTIAHTGVAHVSNVARDELYKANDDIVSKYRIVATLDGRTSATCRGLDSQVFPVGKGPLPPFHPRCRTTTAPVIDDDFLAFLDEGAMRAARGADGGTQVDAGTSYYEFLQMQPAWFQDEALGPVRGNIFRNSGMTAEEFRSASVDGFGRPLTLREMAENDKRVAKFLSRNS